MDTTPSLLRVEVEAAIRRLKTKKSSGLDNITAEEIQATNDRSVDVLFALSKKVWKKEQFPSTWKKSVIVPLYKKKDKLCCYNYGGMSLLSHCEKLMASILLQRIRKRTDEVLTEAQAGFRAGRSTIDQLFTLRRMTEEYIEYGKDLYVCSVDFQKAFDSVWRAGLWQVMLHLRYDEKIIILLEALYKDTLSAVRVDGELAK